MKQNKKLKNDSDHIRGTSKKRVHWDPSIIDNEYKISKYRKTLADKLHRAAQRKSDIEAIKNHIIESFKAGKYEELREELKIYANESTRVQVAKELYGEHSKETVIAIKTVIGKLFSFDVYSVFNWAAANSDIKALKLIAELTLAEDLKCMLSYDKYTAFNLFLMDQQARDDLGWYKHNECIEGFKILLGIEPKFLSSLISNSRYTTDNITRDYNIALQELTEEQIMEDYSSELDYTHNKEKAVKTNLEINKSYSFAQRIKLEQQNAKLQK